MHALHALLQHAQDERDAAFAARSRALAAEQAAQAQAEQLVAYRSDYERRWRAEFARGHAVAVLHSYRGFAERLAQAIQQQRAQLAHLRAQRERIDALLVERERKLAATAKLIERRRADMARVEARRERRLDDEIANVLRRQHAAADAQGEET